MKNGFCTLIILFAYGFCGFAAANPNDPFHEKNIQEPETVSTQAARTQSITTEQTHEQPSQSYRWGKEQQLVLEKTAYLAGYELIMMYGLAQAPQSITHWEPHKRKVSSWPSNWRYNVTHAPVLDGDHLAMNFVAHPISGAGYYQVARSSWLSPAESFGYSAIESNVIWEYGFEALIERPSVQDLIITPALGSLLGELEYRLCKKIEAQDGKVLGSKALGSTALFLLNPFNGIIEAARGAFNSKQKTAVMAAFSITPEYEMKFDHAVKKGNRFLLQLHINV